jgi:hypothetical protein
MFQARFFHAKSSINIRKVKKVKKFRQKILLYINIFFHIRKFCIKNFIFSLATFNAGFRLGAVKFNFIGCGDTGSPRQLLNSFQQHLWPVAFTVSAHGYRIDFVAQEFTDNFTRNLELL